MQVAIVVTSFRFQERRRGFETDCLTNCSAGRLWPPERGMVVLPPFGARLVLDVILWLLLSRWLARRPPRCTRIQEVYPRPVRVRHMTSDVEVRQLSCLIFEHPHRRRGKLLVEDVAES